MRKGILEYKEVSQTSILKPNFHLNEGKRSLANLACKGIKFVTLGEIVQNVYTGGIFKRIFVSSENAGIPYISAQDMMNQNPKKSAKLISRKYTPRQNDMTLRENTILVSCAGTVGNIRLIDASFKDIIGSQDIIRVIPDISNYGFIYAYLSSKVCYSYIQSLIYGSVVPRIEPNAVSNIPVPIFPESKQQEIHNLIVESANLRVEANRLLEEAKSKLLVYANLPQLTIEDYDYFGARANGRNVSYFSKNIKAIDSTTINAFNHSIRIETTKRLVIDACETVPLEEMLDDKKLFSTGSFPRVEVKHENGIMLINQKDIFDTIVRGKRISRRKVKLDNLVEYGEVLIAGVGTLGENETFCRSIFANEDLKGQLVSGEFIRMKTKDRNLSGYLFAWLSSDYGFRLIRNTQTGTKLCRPILRLLLQIPVPVLDLIQMKEIDDMIKKAHSFYYKSNSKENQAIQLVEKEIESWQ